jgi:O-antigen ligase
MHLALAMFLTAVLGAWWFSPYPDEGTLAVEHYLKTIVFYVLAVTSVRDERNLRRILACFLVAVGLYMGHSLLEFFNGRFVYRQGIRRMVGVSISYSDPNSFALTLLLTLPMLLPFWAEARTRARKLLLLGFMGCAAVCILLTGSRTGFVGLVAFALLWSWFTPHRKTVILLLGLGALVACMLMPDYLVNRFYTLVDPSVGPANAQESAEGRLEGFLVGMRLWSENPMFGVGPSAFAVASGEKFQAHNVYGQVGSELGTLGMAGFLALVACFFLNWREARRLDAYFRQRSFMGQVARSAGLAVLLLLLTGWASHNAYRFNWVWFAAFQASAVFCLRARLSWSQAWRPAYRLAHA